MYGSPIEDAARISRPSRAPYSKPVLEDLGSLPELTAAGGPNFGVDSAYVGGNFGSFGVS
ncbi:MAG: lasso RiPP family leader peptide-containing protein [Solirubrobacteraceae bacterium]